jgi:hypothetical protein
MMPNESGHAHEETQGVSGRTGQAVGVDQGTVG